jgi:hypothetical protein
MAFRFRLCQNDTTSALRDLFNATPMRVPEASIQPMLVVAEQGGKTDKRGELRHLLSLDAPLPIEIKESPVSDVSLERTRSMDWDFGFKLLDGFFQGFNLPSAAIGAKLNNAKEVSLSFKNVKRRNIDKNQLGSALIGKTLNLAHPAAQIFLGENAHNMLLVTDVIISNGFAINVVKSHDENANIEVPAIQQIVNEARMNVQVKGGTNNSISFEGADFLTFAFTCVKLDINPNTGALAVGMTVVTRESKSGKKVKTKVPAPVELDDDFFEPGMLEWD